MTVAPHKGTPPDTLRLTAAQRGLWFAQRLDPANPSYNVAEYADIRGRIEPGLLRRAVAHAVDEMDALRSTFGERDGIPFQRVHRSAEIDVPMVDLSEFEDSHAEAVRRMKQALAMPTDLGTGPLVRMTLYRLSSARHLFHQQVHHLVLDGYGAVLALARIAELYTALADAPDTEPPARPVASLAALLEEEDAYNSSQQHDLDREFWTDRLAGGPAPTGLAGRSGPPGHGALSVRREFTPDETARLRAAARRAGTGWPTFFMAALAVCVHRGRGLGEVVLGLPVTGRRTALARSTPGMLSNVLPLRLAISPADRVADLAKRASAGARDVLRHQRHPSESLRHQLGTAGDRTPLTGPSVNILAFDESLRFGPHTATLHNLSIGPVEDLAVAVHASYADGGMHVDLLGNPDLYTQRELADHHARFCRVVEAFAGDPQRTIGSLSLVGDDEHLEVLGLGAPRLPFESGASDLCPLPGQLARQARSTPDETAVVCADTRLTFEELDRQVDVLAAVLTARGAGPGSRVAVGLPRSTALVVAMLAVMRTGAAYLPLDPSYPADRLAFVIEDSRPVALVATAESARLTDPGGSVPLVDPAAATAETERSEPVGPAPHDAAYVIYTSGSTGTPKGVVVEHRSLSNLLDHHRREIHGPAEEVLGRRPRVALSAATSFDASWDPVLWMVAGHELHIVGDDVRRDPQALVDFLVEQRIDAIETTPTYLRQMLTAGLLTDPRHRPRVIALGGEAVDDALWDELAGDPALLVFNYYGPTETTVDAVTTRITGGSPVIGRPVAGAGAYVLDPSLHPLPRGGVGELYLTGEGLARGYAGRPGLTAERFMPDPYGRPGGRMYRTGDLARWSDDGTLEFHGRSDRQIKVRGFRVETGEIEAALRCLPGIEDAAVALTAPQDGPERLAAYLVTATTEAPAPGHAEVRDALAALLPGHMVPSAWATVPRLPITPNGKLDTAGLPEAVPVASDGGRPRTPEESRMCAVFAECLGLPRAGRDDDFFLLGGHSLLAMRLIGRIRGEFGAELPIRALFAAPTPAGLVAALGDATPARPAVTDVRPRPDRVPLSFGQQRLWLLETLGDAGTSYHLPVALRLRGALDREALAQALADLVGRHEILRTLVRDSPDGPEQTVLPAVSAWPRLSVMAVTDPVRPDAAPFDLGRELPLRARLFPVGPDEHLLVVTLHHIAADGWSMEPLMRDLSTAYAARRSGAAPDWAELPVQYADYALWQRRLLGDVGEEGSIAARQLAHWVGALADLPEESAFPTDRPRPSRSSGRGGSVPIRIGAADHRALIRLAGDCGASGFMVLHAALAALMSRLGAGDDIAIGTPVAGRTDEALTGLVGFFVNTLVLRTDTSGAPDFRELVRRVARDDVAAYAHQDIPFERIVEELAPARSLSRHPLFQVMLSLNNTPPPEPVLDDLTVTHESSVGRTGAKFDLTWDLAEHHDDQGVPAGVSGELEFSEDLFDRDTAERFSEHFSRLLSALLADPDRPSADAVYLTAGQRAGALDELSLPAAEPVTGGSLTRPGEPEGEWTVVDVLETRAAVQPGRTAVTAPDGRLTFGELVALGHRLAAALTEAGIVAGDRVAVALPRTSLHIVAVLGVLRAGAVYVPVDPSQPRARNQLILDTAAPRLVLATAGTRAALPGEADVMLLDGEASWRGAEGPLPAPPRGRDAAYVLYTSGSTGVPKGVVVEHRSLANLLTGHRERLMEPAEKGNNGLPLRVALTAAMTFDASWDPLLWMTAGHELHLVDDATRRDPEALTALLHERAIDVVETTPSFLEQLRACGLFAMGRPRPRVLALGGEAVNDALWQELATLHDVTVWNLYGPTETTVDSVMGRILPGSRPHLGRPVNGTKARVLDARLQPVAPGATGELHLAGPGLARGYENWPVATATRFLPDPYGAPGTRMYRTGDLVRRREGRLEYVGRADGQIKVRGFRVETGEIETVLAGHPDVARCAVAVRQGAGGDGRLVGWVVAAPGRDPVGRTLRTYVADRLPAHMVPGTVVTVATLPLTPHGKVDVAALPLTPEAEAGAADDDPPRSAPEEIICALFAESLGHDQVSRTADFFELGGHSLLATRLIGRIRSAFGVELPVRALFESTTPAALAERLGEAGDARPSLRRTTRPDRPPLSPAQLRLWFLHQLDPGTAAYHISIAVRLRGELDHRALHHALCDVLTRHESLRTLIKTVDGEPYQAVLAPGDARITLPVMPVEEAALDAALRDSAADPFDLANEVPMRAALFSTGEDRHALLLTMHHIAADGWSMGPLAQDLAGAYAARTAGRAPNWDRLPVQYTDYTLWQRSLLGDVADPASLATGQLAYWYAELTGAPEETPLPVDRPRPATSGGRGGTVPLHLCPETTAALARLARSSATSTFMVLHAALVALLHRIGGGSDIVIGTPVAGRTDEALEPLVGFFVNTLALRTDLSDDPSFDGLLAQVRETDLAAYAHQELPFERLVEALRPTRSPVRHPLFQVMLGLNNHRPPQLNLPGLHAQVEGVDTGGAKFDLSFSFTERSATANEGATLAGTLEFSHDLFDRGTAQRMADWFGRLVSHALRAPGTRISDLPLIGAEESDRLLALGDGGHGGAAPATVLDRFTETVAAARSGDIAVTAPDGSVSFAELDDRSDRIAELLRGAGIGSGEPVAVLLPRSVDSIAALLGVLKAGAVYAPVDDSLPQGRIDAVLADARPSVVLTVDATAPRVADGWRRLNLDGPQTARPPESVTDSARAARPGAANPAYLLHTSGSTGRPKGVLVGHGSLARLLEHHRRNVFGPAVRASGKHRLQVALTAALSFDASWDPVLWMIDGHTLHVLDDLTRRDPEALAEAVRIRGLDVLESTPTHVRQLLDTGLLSTPGHAPAVLILGGEAVPAALWSTLREHPGVRSLNFYGPTEATVDTLTADVRDHTRPVLGTPVGGTRAHLLDTRLRPVPVGVTGDLYLAGDSPALGYYGRPSETACAFLPDPYGPAGARMYRTGDRAVRASDGALEFAGRDDGQVKVRGFRVEPDEIAAVLESHPDVVQAAVVPHSDGPEGTRLAAYLVTATGARAGADGPDAEDGLLTGLREHAAARLPAYMVPSGWLAVDRIPLTPSGKLDRVALPDPASATGATGTGRSPRNPREDVLCTLFAEVLDHEKIQIDDDFFALGGHSLLATRLIGRIRTTLGVDVSIRSLFEAPTVATLAERLLDGSQDNPLATLLPLRTTGSRPPLFCVHPAGGLAWSYGGLLPHLDGDQPVYGLQTPNLDGTAQFPGSIEDMASVYVGELRGVQPHGPYHLFGWSFGGNVVQEVAVQLQEAGEQVALLTILDAFPLAPLDDLDSAGRDTVFRALLANMGVGEEVAAGVDKVDAASVREEFRRAGSPLGSLEPATIDAMVDNFAGQARLMRAYTPRRFHGPVLFFTATEGRPRDTFALDLWTPYVDGHIENHDVACAHAQMMAPAAREQIGTTVSAALRANRHTAQGELS